MKINEVEAAVGVTKKNIRFYEEEGLISPRREPGNGYRSYSEADIERLRALESLECEADFEFRVYRKKS
mgnify:CR=1 FL=1